MQSLFSLFIIIIIITNCDYTFLVDKQIKSAFFFENWLQIYSTIDRQIIILFYFKPNQIKHTS